jgi:hypothetical protein
MSPARANRVHLIRRRAVGAAVAVFVAIWGVIGVQLASGNDPALSSGSSTTGTTSTTTSSTSASTTSTADQQVTTSDQSSQAVSPVTTSQS